MGIRERIATKALGFMLRNANTGVNGSNWLDKIAARLTSVPSHFTAKDAKRLPAVRAAIGAVSKNIAALPMSVYDVRRDGTEEEVSPTDPEVVVVTRRWSAFESANDGIQRIIAASMLRGAGSAWVERGAANRIVSIRPLPGGMVKRVRRGGEIVYELGGLASDYGLPGNTNRIPRDDLIYLSFEPPEDGVTDISPLDEAWDSIRSAIAATVFSGWFFERGAVPQVYVIPGAASKNRLREQIKAMWRNDDLMRRENRSSTILPPGHDVKSVGSGPRDAGVDAQRLFGIGEVARIYDIPPIVLHDLSRSTYSNYGQARRAMAGTLEHWARRFSMEISNILWPDGRRVLRFDTSFIDNDEYKRRMEAHKLAIDIGVKTRNQVIEEDGGEPVDEDDPQYEFMSTYNERAMTSTVNVNQGTTSNGGGSED